MKEAANSLLKVLKEAAPTSTHLLAGKIRRLLATIRPAAP